VLASELSCVRVTTSSSSQAFSAPTSLAVKPSLSARASSSRLSGHGRNCHHRFGGNSGDRLVNKMPIFPVLPDEPNNRARKPVNRDNSSPPAASKPRKMPIIQAVSHSQIEEVPAAGGEVLDRLSGLEDQLLFFRLHAAAGHDCAVEVFYGLCPGWAEQGPVVPPENVLRRQAGNPAERAVRTSLRSQVPSHNPCFRPQLTTYWTASHSLSQEVWKVSAVSFQEPTDSPDQGKENRVSLTRRL